MTTQPKARYPVQVFNRLKNYPCRHCQNPECGKQLTPRYTLYQDKQHRLESVETFKARKYCSRSCSAQVRARELAEARSERIQKARERTAKRTEVGERQKAQQTSPPVQPVQDVANSPTGLVAPEIQQSIPPALLAISIPTNFILQPELAKQRVITIEQVEAMTDDDLLVLPRVSKAKLKMLRSQIAGAKKALLDRMLTNDIAEPSAADCKEPSGMSKSVSLAEPVQNAQNEQNVKSDVQPTDALRLEPPTLTDLAYGGPPAPENVAEEADPETWRPGELQAGTALADLASNSTSKRY